MDIKNLEESMAVRIKGASEPFSRAVLFIVYFWFGILKVFNASPANPLVAELQARTLPFLSFGQFIVLFGVFEMLIGLMFLFPKLTKFAILALVLHMILTFGPMVLMPEIAWQKLLVPTLEGQYILKNLLTLALAVHLWAGIHPAKT